MFVAKAVNDGELRHEITFAFDVVSRELLYSNLSGGIITILLQNAFVNNSKSTLPQFRTLIEVFGRLLQILIPELSGHPCQPPQVPQHIAFLSIPSLSSFLVIQIHNPTYHYQDQYHRRYGQQPPHEPFVSG